MAVNRSIFRQQALEHYQQIQQPKTLPKFASPFKLLWYWTLFFICVATIIGLWVLQVPVIEQGAGGLRQLSTNELAAYNIPDTTQKQQTLAIVFFPEASSTTLRVAMPISLVVSGVAMPLTGKVLRLVVQTLSPQNLQQTYHVQASTNAGLQVMTVAFVGIQHPPIVQSQVTVPIIASYQTGTTAVLPLLLKTFSMQGGA